MFHSLHTRCRIVHSLVLPQYYVHNHKLNSMKGVSYFIVSPRIGKLPNWPYVKQLVPRTILVGWNAELPRKVIVGEVHEVYTQHGV